MRLAAALSAWLLTVLGFAFAAPASADTVPVECLPEGHDEDWTCEVSPWVCVTNQYDDAHHASDCTGKGYHCRGGVRPPGGSRGFDACTARSSDAAAAPLAS